VRSLKACSLAVLLRILTLTGPSALKAGTNKAGPNRLSSLFRLATVPARHSESRSGPAQQRNGFLCHPFYRAPGRVSCATSIGLQYNGGDRNGPAGLSLRLNLPSLQRQTDKGLAYYANR